MFVDDIRVPRSGLLRDPRLCCRAANAVGKARRLPALGCRFKVRIERFRLEFPENYPLFSTASQDTHNDLRGS
jgi:hypothetical protein